MKRKHALQIVTGAATIRDRRPGLQEVVDRIQRQNPKWSLERCIAQAKVQWTDDYNRKKGSS